jgi:hypothetical protein
MGVESNGTANGHGNGVLSTPPTTQHTAGGGALTLDLANVTRDMETLHRALTQWPARFRKIDAAMRDRMVMEAQVALDRANTIEDPDVSERVRLTALRVLTAMDQLNSHDEDRAISVAIPKRDKGDTNVQVNVGIKMYAHDAPVADL